MAGQLSMSHLKTFIIEGIIEREGGYVNDPDDSGGETMYGITVKVAREYGYTGPMASMPHQTAFDIYTALYWDALSLDQVELISPLVAEEMADTSVNQGAYRAGSFLQRSLNALNDRERLYPDLKVDGKVGTRSIDALEKFSAKRGQEGVSVLHRMLNALQGAFYVSLVERREKDEKFIYGWFLNRVS